MKMCQCENEPGMILLIFTLIFFMKIIFFQQMRELGQQYDSLIKGGKIMYRFRNSKGIYVGEIFLDNRMSITYYTSEAKMEVLLRVCILSCRLE